MIKYCQTCAIADLEQNRCKLFRHQITPATDFCSKHHYQLFTCELCGAQVLPETAIFEPKDEMIRCICRECNSKYGTCALCRNGQTCSFETDPSSLPKVVNQQIRQGHMITVQQIRNPDRIAITCEKGCLCFDTSLGCLRQFNTCERCDNI